MCGAEDHTATYLVHDSWIAAADGASMQVRYNGALVKTMPVSLGAPPTPTYGVCPGHPGYYKETVKLDERISNDGKFGHAAPWSTAQQGHANVSHGCIDEEAVFGCGRELADHPP